jgi:hypothetical protein
VRIPRQIDAHQHEGRIGSASPIDSRAYIRRGPGGGGRDAGGQRPVERFRAPGAGLQDLAHNNPRSRYHLVASRSRLDAEPLQGFLREDHATQR